jgi:hypothetical protein
MKTLKNLDSFILLLIYIYIAIPIALFLVGWFKLYVSIPSVIILILSIYFVYKNELVNSINLIFTKKWIFVAFISFVWVFLSGIGGFSFQNGDFNGRNAIFRDLVNFPWPVKFDYSNDDIMRNIFGNTGMMDYYFAFWLPSALVGKLCGWGVGNAFLLFWTWLGVMGAYYLLSRIIGKVSIIAAIVLVFWSGLDIVGYLLSYWNTISLDLSTSNLIYNLFVSHKEWWSDRLQFSSMSVQLYWVFNQALPTWIITFLLVKQKNMKSIAFISLLLIPYAPIPFIGIFALLIYVVIFGPQSLNILRQLPLKKDFYKDIIGNVREAITFQNIAAAVVMFLFVLLFSLNTENSSKGLIFDRGLIYHGFISGFWQLYALFVLFEFGLYAIVVSLNKNINKTLLLYVSFILLIIPFFYFGRGNDFCMRASIPLLLILLTMTAAVLSDFWNTNQRLTKNSSIKNFTSVPVPYFRENFIVILTSVLFIIGSFNPISEIYRSYTPTVNSYILGLPVPKEDRWVTFSNSNNNSDGSKSFVVSNYVVKYEENNFIIKYLIR